MNSARLLIACAVFGTFAMCVLAKCEHDCTARGGVLVRGIWGVECVEAKR